MFTMVQWLILYVWMMIAVIGLVCVTDWFYKKPIFEIFMMPAVVYVVAFLADMTWRFW